MQTKARTYPHGKARDPSVSVPLRQLWRADPRCRTGVTASIDAPDAKAVAAALKEKGWRLTHILTTHHHGDHTAGNLALKARPSARSSARAARPPRCRASTSRWARATPSSSARTRCGCSTRPATPPATSPTGSPGRRGLRRRHAVRHRLRPRHRGQRADDVAILQETDGAAEGDRRLLRPRVHPGQRHLRSPSSPRMKRCRSAPRRSTSCAPPAKATLPTNSPSRSRPIRSCAPTSPQSRSASA